MLEICIFDDDLRDAQTARDQIAVYAVSVGLVCDISIYTTEKELMTRAKKERQIDLLFSDIHLGAEGKNGIEVVKRFQKIQPACKVVYLTNYLVFATDVYDTPHFYFVLKSELEQRLPDVLSKVMTDLPCRHEQMLRIRKKNAELMIAQEDIIYCEHHGRTTDIVTTGEIYAVNQKVSEVMEMLDSKNFVRCHSSYIVGLRFVSKFRRTNFVMINGQTIPISRPNTARVKEIFGDFLNRVQGNT